MEDEEENGANVNLKRQRAPLSDSEDNVPSTSEGSDGQKRRRLEAAGRENRSPQPSCSGRLAELDTKPDTPMVPSVRSRVHQLTQRREGGAPLAQRCFSDPGSLSPSLMLHEKGFREHILGQGEFNQRMERFKVPVFLPSPAPSPSHASSPRTRSSFVSAIQQKLHGTPALSSKLASRIRQERDDELSHLPFQPISENAWLKRSNSDPSLSQPLDGDAEMTDGSFTDASASCAEKPSSHGTGERASEAPEERDDAPRPGDEVRQEEGSEGKQPQTQQPQTQQPQTQQPQTQQPQTQQPQTQQPQTQQPQTQQPQTQQPQTQTVLKLSFSEDQGSSEVPFGGDQSEFHTSDEQSYLESTLEEQSDMTETVEVSVVTEETFSYEARDGSSNSEGGAEPSTDEELRSWRYPLDENRSVVEQEVEVCVKEEQLHSYGEEKGRRGCDAEHSEHSDIQDSECYLGDVSAETTGSSDVQDDEKGGCSQGDDVCQQSYQIQTVSIEDDDMDLEPSPPAAAARALKTNMKPAAKRQASDTETDSAPSPSEVSDPLLEKEHMERGDGRPGVGDGLRGGGGGGGGSSKKVTFILEPELIADAPLSEANGSTESRAETSVSDGSHDDTHTAEIIDQMFEEVLEYAGRMEEERGEDAEDRGISGVHLVFVGKDKMDAESEKSEEDGDASRELESNRDELTFPPSGILSPLSKSVEAVVTPLRLAASQESIPASLLLTPEEASSPVAEPAPLYSIDAYRTQRQSNLPTIQSVTPGVQRRAPEKLQPSVNIKEKITALSEEAGKLQTVINQTLQALSCCTDEEHGRGSLEEAEAEKLLLVSCEKRSALLAEVTRLREERSADPGEDGELVSQQACRGTVSITKIQLPLKVEFVCSSHKRTGRPSHYFFVLIRYGPCNLVATPLATAADAQHGDTISFSTSVTLKDIRSSFEIDVEVYSLSHPSGSSSIVDRTSTKSRVTPRKLLKTIGRSSNSLTSGALPALNTRRSSNFFLVGSHQITLASLGHSKFPLDKMKLEGKIRRLLGDEFQEKVPFLSPLEGNIYLHLDSESHSDVQHRGFLTMFELISGFGVWHRRYFVLVGCNMFYWNHPNDKESKEAEGSISLSSAHSRCVRPVKRDSCARPFTFELVSIAPQQQDASAKCWFSADTKQERLDWMEKLNQVLLDFNTWNRTPAAQPESQPSSSSNLRESIL